MTSQALNLSPCRLARERAARTASVLGELRMAVMDIEAYAWTAAGERGSFLQWINRRDDDLVCRLVGFKQMARWPEGGDIVWQVRQFLLRLTRLVVPGRMQARDEAGRRP